MKAERFAAVLFVLIILLTAAVGGCGRNGAVPEPAGPSEPAEPAGQSGAGVGSGRRDGERFEEVIILEGMEETVRYEHIRNEALGFEMDYDCELFVRRSESDRECFISIYDDPDAPENYLEVTFSTEDADAASAAAGEALSKDYEILRSDFVLDRAGSCIRIDASEAKGRGGTPDLLQMVYIIPAPDGSRVAAAHYSFESAEGFGRRFRYMMDTLTVIDRSGERKLSDEQALSAIRSYCLAGNPDLEGIANAGEYPVYWEITSSGEHEVVVLFRSYTGAQLYYHIDRLTGDAYVTELVPGISAEEKRTEESLNAWEWEQKS